LRRAAWVTLWVLLAVAPTGAAAEGESATGPATLRDVRVETAPDGRPTIRIVGDRPMHPESFVLERPYRLVVDLPDVIHQLGYSVEDHDSFGVRTAQFRTGPRPICRVVIDLDRPRAYDVHSEGPEVVVRLGEPVASFGPTELPEWVEADDTPAPRAEADSLTEVLREAAGEPGPSRAEDEQRSIEPEAIERLLESPRLGQEAAPEPAQGSEEGKVPPSFQTQTIVTESVRYTGKRISLNLVDADVKQVFRLFHEISGINFVLDPSVSGRVSIVVDNVPWDQALDLILKNNGLDKVLENNVIRIATTQKLAEEASRRKALKEAKELEAEPITLTRTLSYAKAKEVERVIREGGVLSQRGKVIVDERTNTLIISDIPKKVEPVDQLLSTLDSETPQVMIEARVVETSRDFVQDLGVVWGLNAIADASRGTQTGLSFPNNASLRYGLNLPGAGGASTLAVKLGNIIDSFTLDVALNTLETEGRARVLSSPRIATQNNERAEIEQGVRIPVVNTTATEINVEFVSASLRLEVTPQITAEGTVILDIVVENNSPDFVNRVESVPPINTQRAQTKVLIEDGGTTVIGGIFSVTEGTSETGVPWFRKVPVFGWLFKTQNITRQNRELLIFITPKITKLS
jgi:type IV pilus assembly protein PilQ